MSTESGEQLKNRDHKHLKDAKSTENKKKDRWENPAANKLP